ncbi:MAG: YgaP-like transmembrane domain [Verrucomicrobiota bacterium]
MQEAIQRFLRNPPNLMPLTYQPFAEVPQVEELRQDLQMNVSDNERMISGGIGAGLIAMALSGSGFSKWLVMLLGGALIHRGLTGQCALYQHLDVDRRHIPGRKRH